MFEIEDLIEPIDGDLPTGRDLRLDPGDLTFQLLKDHSTAVDAAVAASESEIREPNWSAMESLCMSALQEKSKDLELAASLSQAWAQMEGAVGVRHGLDLVHQLLERYWETIHPGVDADDGSIVLPLRARWLNWLDSPNGLIKAIKQGPMVRTEGGTRYSWQDHENSALLDDATLSVERRQELVETGIIDDAQWSAALAGMGPDRIREITEALGSAMEITRSLGAFCAEHLEDDDAPDFYNLLNTFEEMQDYLQPHVADAAPVDEVSRTTHSPQAASASGSPAAAAGPICSRDQALRTLQEVGDYFRRTEPHSPISYLITRAARWGSMPLDQLLKDVVRNDDVIEHIWETLGLDASKNDADDDDEY